jgi:MbtH protein
MNSEEKEDTTIYKVVLNHEEQYSIWPVDRENPLGWRDAGKSGTKAECLAYIKEVWTEMRPLSLRKKMEEEAPKTNGSRHFERYRFTLGPRESPILSSH